MEDHTYVEHPERVRERGVACRDAGEYFVAPQVAFKERLFAQLVEENVDFFKRTV